MPLTPDVDSYVDVAEADDYFSSHFGYEEWDTLDEVTKEQVLRSAVKKLDLSCSWYGDLCQEDQPLAFPRTEQECVTPQGIKDAQCEIAYLMVLAGSANATEEAPLSELTAGPVTMKWFDKTDAVDPLESGLISSLISQYGLCGSTSGGTYFVPIERA